MAANNVIGSFEDTFEQGISQVTQHAKFQAATTAKVAATQAVGTSQTVSSQVSDSLQAQPATDSTQSTDQFNETMTQTAQGQMQNPQDKVRVQREKEELERRDGFERDKKLKEARERLQQLHNQVYYDPTFNRRHKEPSVQDRLEQEEAQKQQQEMVDLQEKKKKEPPLALRQAQTKAEIQRGASG